MLPSDSEQDDENDHVRDPSDTLIPVYDPITAKRDLYFESIYFFFEISIDLLTHRQRNQADDDYPQCAVQMGGYAS